ncbi:MAG: hypothetical protein MUQ10_15715, partial [Anaerolineae bacterium]|nr:hypothetical protein [Anaerolineae bacterium]
RMPLWRPVKGDSSRSATIDAQVQRKVVSSRPASARRPIRSPGVVDLSMGGKMGAHLSAPSLYLRGPNTYVGPVPALTASGVARRFRGAGPRPPEPEVPSSPAEELRAILRRLRGSREPELPLADAPRHTESAVSKTASDAVGPSPQGRMRGAGSAQGASLFGAATQQVEDVVARRSPGGPVVVQRQVSEPISGRSGADMFAQRAAEPDDEDEESGDTEFDVTELARRVFPRVKRLLRLERERLPRASIR